MAKKPTNNKNGNSKFEPLLKQDEPTPLRRNEFFLAKSKFDHITNHLYRSERARANLQKEIDKTNKKKELSKEMTKNWSQTIERMVTDKHEAFLKQRQQVEDQRNKLFYESSAKFAEESKLFVQEARRSLYLKECFPLELTNAMKCGQVEKERGQQIELKKSIKKHEEDVEADFARKVAKAAGDEVAEKAEAARKRREDAIEYRKLCYNQYLNKKAADRLEKEARMNSEIEDNMKNVEEIQALELQQLQKADEYKKNLKKSCDQDFALRNSVKEKLLKEDEQQEEAMKVYKEAKHVIECTRKMREKEKIVERLKKAEMFGEANEEERLAQEERENALLEKANKEREEAEEQRRLADAEKVQRFKEDLKQTRQEQLVKEERERKENETMLRWQILNRNKQVDVINEAIQKERAKHLQKKIEYRKELFEQMDVVDAKKEQEKQSDKDLANDTCLKFQEMDDKFFNYAREVKEMCNANNWNTYAVEKVVKQYKKTNNLESGKCIGVEKKES